MLIGGGADQIIVPNSVMGEEDRHLVRVDLVQRRLPKGPDMIDVFRRIYQYEVAVMFNNNVIKIPY